MTVTTRRWITAFACAVGLHGAALTALLLLPVAPPGDHAKPVRRLVAVSLGTPRKLPARNSSAPAPPAAASTPPRDPPPPARPPAPAPVTPPTATAVATTPPTPKPPEPAPPQPAAPQSPPPQTAAQPQLTATGPSQDTGAGLQAQDQTEADTTNGPPAATAELDARLQDARAGYEARLGAWLNRHKRYPLRARQRRQEGTALLRFTVDRNGTVIDYSLQESSGSALLDRAVLALIKRAQPLPAIPDLIGRNSFEVVVPIQFELR